MSHKISLKKPEQSPIAAAINSNSHATMPSNHAPHSPSDAYTSHIVETPSEPTQPESSSWLDDQTLSEMEHYEHDWLWPDYIPCGAFTVIEGVSGIGKSLVQYDLAARVSTGKMMPDGSEKPAGKVLIVCDAVTCRRNVRPGLLAAGADLSRIIPVTHARKSQQSSLLATSTDSQNTTSLPDSTSHDFHFTHDDLLYLIELIKHHQPRLLIIDNLFSLILSNQDTRYDLLLSNLKLLETSLLENSVACLVTRQVGPRGQSDQIPAVERSPLFTRMAQASFFLTPNPEHPDRIMFICHKHLASEPPYTFCFQIQSSPSNPQQAIIKWRYLSYYRYSDVMTSSYQRLNEKRQEIMRVLTENCYAPMTVEEIHAQLSHIKKSVIGQTLHRMAKSGYISYPSHNHYAINLPTDSHGVRIIMPDGSSGWLVLSPKESTTTPSSPSSQQSPTSVPSSSIPTSKPADPSPANPPISSTHSPLQGTTLVGDIYEKYMARMRSTSNPASTPSTPSTHNDAMPHFDSSSLPDSDPSTPSTHDDAMPHFDSSSLPDSDHSTPSTSHNNVAPPNNTTSSISTPPSTTKTVSHASPTYSP